MRRAGNLIEAIADYDNLHRAFIKACSGKQAKAEVVRFRSNFDENIRNLRNSLLSGSVQIGDYNYFTIHDPKERLICAASFQERVLHHAIMNVCHNVFERSLIYDTYATRSGKGVYAALDRAVKSATRFRYVVKLDFRKYFDSIDHLVLKKKLLRLFKDELLLSMFYDIIDSYCTDSGKGIPIGNLTSQYFANHYLSSLDHRMKSEVRVPVYVRYMDDILMMANDKKYLEACVAEIVRYSSEELKLKLKSPVYREVKSGIPFLGYVVRPGYLTLSGRSKVRFRKKLRNVERLFAEGQYTEQEYQQHLLPLLAFVGHAQSKRLRQSCLKELGIDRSATTA